ncbi:MAG: hypothetical protein KJ915_01440 [Candidatus Omnitrophica bacterium]|nr:hypothetical protein [Candidatus Omnitrophota bacterium]
MIMKGPKKPSEHDIWFVNKIRKDNSLNKVNTRQQRIVDRVRRWEKYHGPIDQQDWKF